MTPDQAIIAILENSPGRAVRGKKRLQKLAYLWKSAGLAIEAEFRIKHYGPFSSEIENASSLLSLFGDINEKEIAVGYANFLTTEFSLPSDVVNEIEIPKKFINLLNKLDEFDTVELEVASTIVFFLKAGFNFNMAIDRTKAIKPTKVNSRTIESSKKIISLVGVNS